MSLQNPLISILMPVKNAAPFLNKCIQSIIDQTESHWDLIAIDDGSTDSSHAILSGFAQKDERIVVLKNNGSGIIDALRTAYSKSQGSLITRMDADDIMAPQKLEILKHHLLDFGEGHIAVGMVKYFSEIQLGNGYLKYENWLNSLTQDANNFNDIYKECVIPSPCWMVYRKDLYKCDAFNPNVYPEDYDLCFRFYREKLMPIPCNQVLHFWRDHPERSSRNDDHYANNQFLELKVKWFLELDFNPEKPLVVWGAGSKGKTIAKLLKRYEIDFRWICNNPNKIGKHVYGIQLESTEITENQNELQVIVAVANPDEQNKIGKAIDTEAFWFC